jgi:hypothetical protein
MKLAMKNSSTLYHRSFPLAEKWFLKCRAAFVRTSFIFKGGGIDLEEANILLEEEEFWLTDRLETKKIDKIANNQGTYREYPNLIDFIKQIFGLNN